MGLGGASRWSGERTLKALVLIAVFAAVFLVAVFNVHAAPPEGADPNSALSLWFKSLVNSKGEYCCSVADCRPVRDWKQTGEGYQVKPQGSDDWIPVPPENVLRRENPLGQPVACVIGGIVRCFVAPPET